MTKIEIGNIKCKLLCSVLIFEDIYKYFKIKHPQAFYIRRSGNCQPDWDGCIDYITSAGYFKIGLLPQVIEYLQKKKFKYELVDVRDDIIKPKLPEKVGNLEPRHYQANGIEAFINNKVDGLHYPIGVIDAATNAGKTMFMAGLYLAYKRKYEAIVLINDKDLYDQMKVEMPLLIGDDDFGYIQGKDFKQGKFMVCMVQTLSKNIKAYRKYLTNKKMVLVDECDLADNKTYKTCIQALPETLVRAGLSGSIFLKDVGMDKIKNQNLHEFFGNTLFKVTKREMVDWGYSTEVEVNILKGSTIGAKPEEDYRDEYDRVIIYDESRNIKILRRLKYMLKRRRYPALVICKYHNHIELMYQMIKAKFGNKYTIGYVHHDIKNRKQIIQDFKEGKIDILVGSYILRRGKNLPLTRYISNVSGGKSEETVIQIIGRLERKHDKKSKAHLDDWFDEGKYLKRHSKRRVMYYKKMKFKVKTRI